MFERFAEQFMEGVKNVLLGWIPDWLWTALAWWPWILGAIALTMTVAGLYRVYRIGGWPALTTAVGAIGVAVGYVLGRRGVKPAKKQEQVVVPKPVKKRKHRKTLLDPDGDGKIG